MSSKPKTILHVIDKFSMDDTNPSSCTKLLGDWAAHHQPGRFTTVFCGLQRDGGGEFLSKRGYPVHYIERGKISPAIIGEIVTLARQVEADLLHLHGYSAANFGRLAAGRLGVPAIVHEHAILKVKPHQFVADWLLRWRTDCAVAISQAVREFMIRGRSVPSHRIQVIHNGIELDTFADVEPERTRALRARFGIADSARVVGALTRFREEKGTRYLIDACGRLAGEFTDVVFVVAGEGPEREQLEAQARSLGLGPDRLRMPGFLDDVPAALDLMDIAVVPSIREGLSLTVMEAMAAGKAIVATRTGGITELVTHEETALLAPPADGEGLAMAIARLLRDPGLAGELAARAAAHSKHFSIEQNVKLLEELYAWLIDGHDVTSFPRIRHAA